MNTKEPIILDAEIRNLIPPLTKQEYQMLEASLVSEGCRDGLVTWQESILSQDEMGRDSDGQFQTIVLDGHNRLEICEKHDIDFDYTDIDIDPWDRNGAEQWVIRNQLGRRNLTTYQRAELALKMKPLIAEKAKEKQREHGGTAPGKTLSQKSAEVNTKKELASIAGVSHDTIHKAAVIAERAPEPVKAKLRTGDISINRVYNDIKREGKRKEVIEKLENIEAKEAKAIEGIYDVIVIDPPWPMKKIDRDERPNQSEFDYPTMDLEEITATEVPCADDCHVWLWTTQKFLPLAFQLLESWKLKYVCSFVWHKPGGFQPYGLPQYNAEFALYARKGTPTFIDTKDFPICFVAPRGGHSEKPEWWGVYDS